MNESNSPEIVTITVPKVSGEEALAATDLVEEILRRNALSVADGDALFAAMVAIYIRTRMVYGDKKPEICSLSCATEEMTGEDN